MAPKLLTIGHTTYDTFLRIKSGSDGFQFDPSSRNIILKPGVKIAVNDVNYAVGGGAANVAVGVSRLEISSSIYTIVGDDMRGRDIKDKLKEAGVDCRHIAFDDFATDQSAILSYTPEFTGRAERNIFTYSCERGYKWKKDFVSCENVYIASIGKSIGDFYGSMAFEGKRLFFTPGSAELKYDRKAIVKMLPHIDYFIANVEEGCVTLNSGLKRDQIEIDDLLRQLLNRGIGNVVLTDGVNGVYMLNKDDSVRIKAHEVEVVEKTGAGDAFTSGFIAAILHGKSFKEAGKWGVANSAAVITRIGAQNGLLGLKSIEEASV